MDNALAVTTDGRKLALDPRLLDPAAPDDPASKLNALVETVHRVWRDTTPTKGAQLVFCDLGVRPTAWGFSVYDEVVRKLTARGIPAGEIACVGEAEYRYVTEGSFDAYLWQALETKAKFIGQVMTGESAARRAGDVGEQTLSYAEVKALASGNPAVLTLAEADAEVQRLGVLKRSHADEQYLARRAVRDLPGEIGRLDTRLAALAEDRATAEANRHAPLVIGHRPVPADDLVATVGEFLDRLPDDPVRTKRQDIGTFRGLALAVERHPGGATDVRLSGATARGVTLSRDAHGPRAVLNAAARLADGYAEACDRTRAEADVCRTQLADHQRRLGATFPHADRLDELVKLRDQLRQALSAPTPGATAVADDASSSPPTTSELSNRIKSLLAAPRTEGEGAKKSRPPTWAERTARRSGVWNGQSAG